MERNLTAIVLKEGKLFVAKGVEIELASQGRSQDEALENLREAFSLWLKHSTTEERKALSQHPLLTRIAITS